MNGCTFKKDGKEYDINTEEGRKKFLEGKKIMWACCFCKKGIDEKEFEVKNPRIVMLTLERNKQMFFAHEECAVKKMTKRCREEIAT